MAAPTAKSNRSHRNNVSGRSIHGIPWRREGYNQNIKKAGRARTMRRLSIHMPVAEMQGLEPRRINMSKTIATDTEANNPPLSQ
jgi:hypothetical protein